MKSILKKKRERIPQTLTSDPKSETQVPLKEDVPTSALSTQPVLLVVAGSYEGVLHAWGIESTNTGSSLVALWNASHHSGPIRCIASNGHWVVTAGNDEKLFVYDAKRSRLHGDLVVDGDVTSMQLVGGYLLSSTNKGKVHVWKTSTWDPVLVIDSHTKACNGLSLHPSGKLALTVGDDKCVCLLNMVRGVKVMEIKHDVPLLRCAMSPTGENYALQSRNKVQIAITATGAASTTIMGVNVNALGYLTETILVLGCDDGTIRLYDTLTATKLDQQSVAETEGLSVRCRDLSLVWYGDSPLITTVSSCGVVTLWKVRIPSSSLSSSAALEAPEAKKRKGKSALPNVEEDLCTKGSVVSLEKIGQTERYSARLTCVTLLTYSS